MGITRERDSTYRRYLVSLTKGGKVVEQVWKERVSDVNRIRLEWQREYGVEVADFTSLDGASGYQAYAEAAAENAANRAAVWCATTGKAYRSDVDASKRTGETRYFIRQSCKKGTATPMGNIWMKFK